VEAHDGLPEDGSEGRITRLSGNSEGSDAAAMRLIASSIVWDNVLPLEVWCGNDYDRLGDFVASGYTAVSLTLAGDNQNISEAVQRVAAARRRILCDPQRFVLIESADDVSRAKREGKLAVGFHFEGTRCFERNLDVVEAFYCLGVRQTILAFNQSNSVGCGCVESNDSGLTTFGRKLVRELSRVGMLVDLSHTGHRTSFDAMAIAGKPCVFSHSNAYTLHPHFRNIRDDQLAECAAGGGVVGISSANEYLGCATVTPEAIFRHLDYIVQKVGSKNVGFGFDIVFDPQAMNRYARERPDEWPMVKDPAWTGFAYGTPAMLTKIVALMIDAGYPTEAVRDVLGQNWMRVCQQVWRQ
jgi:membrane dipeptidase